MYQCMPVAIYGDTVQIALVDPLNPAVIDELGFTVKHAAPVGGGRSGRDPEGDRQVLRPAQAGDTMADVLKELGGSGEIASDEEDRPAGPDIKGDGASDAPIVKFVNLVLMQAVQDRASDIHFEPFEDEFKIRYRVDGALYEMSPPPKHLAIPVASRLKVMANLNISERRLPQDGRISVNIGGRQVDLRMSTLPTHSANRSCCAFWTGPRSRWSWNRWDCRPRSTSSRSRPSISPTASSSSPVPPVRERRPRSILGAAPDQHARLQAAHGRGPRGVRYRGHHAGADQRGRRPLVHEGLARLPSTGSRCDHDRGNARLGDRPDRHPGVTDRPSGAVHPPHQRFRGRRNPTRGHGG